MSPISDSDTEIEGELSSPRDLEKDERQAGNRDTNAIMTDRDDDTTDVDTPPRLLSPHNASRSPEDANVKEKSTKSERGENDRIEVSWDGPDDKMNPRNWSTLYKSFITFLLGMLAFSASLGSSIISPADRTIASYVGVGSEVSVLSVSLYM
ncbi:hypothetical protein ACMFMF_006080 [Clarireedia jacksonii]